MSSDTPNNNPSKIRIRGVSKRFGRKVVLDGVDLDVAAGESVVIIGGSGSGKSVLIKCILGLMRPEHGSIQVDGAEILGLKGGKRDAMMHKFGMLFQGGALFDSLNVWQNVSFGLRASEKVSAKQARETAIENLARVGLGAEVADLRTAELSGGMQKRVALARAITTQPEIIFFDEPTTGLDPIMADVINDLIVETRERMGATTLSITHDMASARKIADRIGMLYHGKIIWLGPVADIDNSGNAYVDQFIHGRATGPIKMDVLKA